MITVTLPYFGAHRPMTPQEAYIQSLRAYWKASAEIQSNLSDGTRYGELCENCRVAREQMTKAYDEYRKAVLSHGDV